MFSSQKNNSNIIFSLYNDTRTVFKLNDIAMLTGDTSFESLNKKLNYYVRTGKILNPRKGIYVKLDYNAEELACRVYIPSYISLEYVLQKSGIIFQYSSAITSVSYLSRSVVIKDTDFTFRKIKNDILINPEGIIQSPNAVNIATPERALLDMLYLNPNCTFDNLSSLDIALLIKLLPVYNSKKMTERLYKILNRDGLK